MYYLSVNIIQPKVMAGKVTIPNETHKVVEEGCDLSGSKNDC
jgi:hypothetical protein